VVSDLCHLTPWVSVSMCAGVVGCVTEYMRPHSHGVCILSGDDTIIIVMFRQHDGILAWTAQIWDRAARRATQAIRVPWASPANPRAGLRLTASPVSCGHHDEILLGRP
jgi:hypothetical protein